MTNLKDILVDRRRESGLTQAQVASKVGVRQQTVARWEDGSSRPSRDRTAELAHLLGGDPEDWLKAAGYTPVARAISQPVRPLISQLPLAELGPTEFERFTHQLVAVLYPSATTNRVGSSGHKQGGADVMVSGAPQGRMLIQCKRVERFGPAQMKKVAAEASEISADTKVVLLSRVASPGARDEAARLGWAIWDHDDIVRLLQQTLSREDARRIVDNFFPGYREHLLGLVGNGPWMEWAEFFGESARVESAFSHTWKLVGRADELRVFMDRVGEDAAHILVFGPAGVGKSRFLLEASQQLLSAGAADRVYFVDSGSQVRLEDFELLGPERTLLVVDDAHNRDDIDVILRGAAGRRSAGFHVCVVFSSRPYGKALVVQDLARVAGELDVAEIEIPRLTPAEARSLAATVLGVSGESVDLQRLVGAVGDSTLFTVVGAYLLRTEGIDPQLLGNADKLREALLDRMCEDYVRATSQLPAGIQGRDLLNLISAVQPLDVASGDALDTAARVLGEVPRDAVVRALGLAGTTGVVAKRGTRLRIQPDLLADHILVEACFDRKLGVATGYSTRVWEGATSTQRRNLLVNLARIEWRLTATGVASGTLLASAWETLQQEFVDAGIQQRASLMELVESISYYQPERALALVQWALNHEIQGEEPGILSPLTYVAVRQACTPVLRNCAYHLDYLENAIDLLWCLAPTDARPTNQYSDHPLRVLSELASFSRFKPIDYSERVIERAIGWLRRQARVVVFDILDEALKWEGQDSIAEGYTIKMTSFSSLALGADRVLSLRRKVLASVIGVLGSKDLEVAARAVQSLETAMRLPFGLMGRESSEAEINAWSEDVALTLHDIAETVELGQLDATIRADLREVVVRCSEAKEVDVRAAAQEVLNALEEDLDLLVTQALIHGPWIRRWKPDEEEWTHEKAQAWLEDLARRLVERSHGATGAVAYLGERIHSIRATAGQVSGTPGPFVAALCRLDSGIADGIVRAAIEEPNSPLMSVVGVALSALRAERPTEALELANASVQTGSVAVKLQVAQAYGWGLSSSPAVTEEEMNLISSLARDDEPLVGVNVLGGFRFLATQDPRGAIDLLLAMRIGRARDLADDALALFSRGEPLTVDLLTAADIKAILDELVMCLDIDTHWTMEFLSKLATSHLKDVVRLFQRRVELAEAGAASREYRPVPLGWHRGRSSISSGGNPDRLQILTELRDWASEEIEGWQRHYMGPELFAAVAGDFDDVAMAVIETGLMADCEIARRVAHLLSGISSRFVWENAEWVVRVLEDVGGRDVEIRKAVESALHTAVVTGIRHGTPGQPFPEDLEQRERSQAIADTLPRGSVGERFYRRLQKSAEESIRRDRDEEWE